MTGERSEAKMNYAETMRGVTAAMIAVDLNIRQNGYAGPPGSGLLMILDALAHSTLGVVISPGMRAAAASAAAPDTLPPYGMPHGERAEGETNYVEPVEALAGERIMERLDKMAIELWGELEKLASRINDIEEEIGLAAEHKAQEPVLSSSKDTTKPKK
jgi:hypothetical protein